MKLVNGQDGKTNGIGNSNLVSFNFPFCCMTDDGGRKDGQDGTDIEKEGDNGNTNLNTRRTTAPPPPPPPHHYHTTKTKQSSTAKNSNRLR